MYAKYIKRVLDFVLSLMALIVLSPLLVILIILGAVFMRGNPFFTQARPGLTGYAQAHGRNAVTWEEKFKMDVWYTRNISFITDVKVIIDTVKVVLKRDGISSDTSATMEEFMGTKEVS